MYSFLFWGYVTPRGSVTGVMIPTWALESYVIIRWGVGLKPSFCQIRNAAFTCSRCLDRWNRCAVVENGKQLSDKRFLRARKLQSRCPRLELLGCHCWGGCNSKRPARWQIAWNVATWERKWQAIQVSLPSLTIRWKKERPSYAKCGPGRVSRYILDRDPTACSSN